MSRLQRSLRRNILAGLAVAVALVGSVFAWAATTQIAGAVMAPGAIVVEGNVRKVQHPTGGVIGEIMARDGQRVKAGDVLVRLDATIARANLAIVTRGIDELSARKARLEAERDDRKAITFPAPLLARAGEPDLQLVLAGERRLFELRGTARNGQKGQLRHRIAQYEQEISGISAQQAAKEQEIVLIQRELEGGRSLFEKNLYSIARLTQIERDATRLKGEHGQLLAAGAQARGRIAEVESQVLQIDRDLASEVARELREAEGKIAELQERKIAAEDQLQRIDIRAPIDGVVHQSTAHTVGGVIGATGEPIMLVVPDGDKLVVEVRVAPQDIDQVGIGQEALLRVLATHQRTTPEIGGIVDRISADAVADQRTGTTHFTVRLLLPELEVARLGDVRLLPGMPVEAFIRTADRKVLTYLIKPLTDQYARAFRER